jgi:hypothetical protein
MTFARGFFIKIAFCGAFWCSSLWGVIQKLEFNDLPPLYLAESRGNLKKISVLVDEGASIDEPEPANKFAFAVLSVFLKMGLDINDVCNPEGCAALHLESNPLYCYLVRRLLCNNSSVNS